MNPITQPEGVAMKRRRTGGRKIFTTIIIAGIIAGILIAIAVPLYEQVSRYIEESK